jgi:hypothetical protein
MAAIASGNVIPRLRQALVWQVKKVAKTMASPFYAAARERILRSGYAKNLARRSNLHTTGALS